MNEQEAKRRSELESIVGAESVAKYSFYDEIDYDNLTVELHLLAVGDRAKSIKGIRELLDIPMAELSRALKGGNNSLLCRRSLDQCANSMDRWQMVRKLRKVKGVIDGLDGKCSVDLAHPDTDFTRKNCDDAELDYLETRLITWM